MEKFKVGVWEEQSGYIYVEAKDKKQAEKIAEELLHNYGIDEFPSGLEYNVQHRAVEVLK